MNFQDTWKDNTEYFKLLELMARLSNLFSDNEIPYLHYRVTENLFCKYYKADNLSRSDTAYDAKTSKFGIGIKTFQLQSDNSVEKVAEFNSISNELKKYKGYDLAYQLAVARNERIELGQRLYGINDGCYHIIGRIPKGLVVFNSEYPFINLNKIHSIKENKSSLQFEDDTGYYSFNYSKSTLFKRFIVPSEKIEIPVSIIQDPYDLLSKLITAEDYQGKYKDIESLHLYISESTSTYSTNSLGRDYVILPLFSTSSGEKYVPEKSGLNQWNASGRPRDPNEVYIPIPAAVNNSYPTFFPERDKTFTLHLPDGRTISAKPCQDNRKALMSNPNLDLGKWLLRDVLKLKKGTLVTIDLLNRMGFDSVIVYKNSESDYSIDVCRGQGYVKNIYE